MAELKETKLYTHPDNQAFLAKLFEKKKITVVDDSNLDVHDFYILNQHSYLDGRLEERIKQSIASVYE